MRLDLAVTLQKRGKIQPRRRTSSSLVKIRKGLLVIFLFQSTLKYKLKSEIYRCRRGYLIHYTFDRYKKGVLYSHYLEVRMNEQVSDWIINNLNILKNTLFKNINQ